MSGDQAYVLSFSALSQDVSGSDITSKSCLSLVPVSIPEDASSSSAACKALSLALTEAMMTSNLAFLSASLAFFLKRKGQAVSGTLGLAGPSSAFFWSSQTFPLLMGVHC
jgi:hypothetical protein